MAARAFSSIYTLMAKRNIIVVGASAGGVQALQSLVSALPNDLPAAIFVVLHIPPYIETQLPEILNRAGRLPAVQARNNEPFSEGHIYIAPPDRHLLLKQGTTVLEAGPRENFNRPAIDPLFRSAARLYGKRVIGIVLSGLLDDGTSGLSEIEHAGGVTIVQDPDEALYSPMPANAMRGTNVDHILRISQMGALLKKLVQETVPDEELNLSGIETAGEELGHPSVYSCPDCGGVLWELEDSNLIRFKCRVGHTYGSEALSARQSEDVEHALWEALTSLEESAGFSRRLAGRAWQRGDRYTALHYELKMNKAAESARIIRDVLLKGTVEKPEKQTEKTESETEKPA